MTYFITIEELKQTTFNANLDDEYIAPALEEAQSIYLREIIGDLLYNSITNKIDSEALSGKYLTLVNQYIKPYLTYKVQSVIVIPLNNKTRNAGVIQQYDQGFNTSTMKDTAYLADYYNSRAEFYANRLTTYLQKNTADFPEYGYSDDNITQPTETQNVTTIFLGGGRKKGCGCNTTPQATTTTVEWDNITNRPDFAQVAYSNDYDDLDNKPEIPSLEGYATETYVTNAVQQVEGEIPTVPTNVSAFTNDAGYLTQHQSLDGYATETWVSEQGFSTFSGSYNDLTDKPDLSAFVTQETVLTYNVWNIGWDVEHTMSELILDITSDNSAVAGRSYMLELQTTDLPTGIYLPVTRVDIEAVYSDGIGGVIKDILFTIVSEAYGGACLWGYHSIGSQTGTWVNLGAGGGGSTQVQSDWNQSDNTAVDYIKNKPTIPTVPTNVSAFTNDAGYTTFDGDYNSLTNKPTIPAAQVQSDWNANSGVAQILNKPTIPTKTSELTNDSGFTTFDGDYNSLTNKPTIPTVPTNVSAFTNDAGYLTQHQSLQGYATETWVQQQGYSTFDGDYNSLSNKPTIPAAQVQSDWNANSGMGEILNKPSMTAETWTFTLSDNTTVTKTVWLQ